MGGQTTQTGPRAASMKCRGGAEGPSMKPGRQEKGAVAYLIRFGGNACAQKFSLAGGIFDVAAGVLHILAKAADRAATGACESEKGAGDEQEGEALMGCFHGCDIGGCAGVGVVTVEAGDAAGYGV
jgi:hypothetical protein